MKTRVVVATAAIALAVSIGAKVSAQAPTPRAASAKALAAAKSYNPPRTPWGHPDIQGIYTTTDENGVPLERPDQFPAAAFGTTIPIDLVAPGDVWGDRVNELNLRFAKVLRFGGTRTHVGVDVFNVLNSDAILTYNQTFQLPSATLPNGSWRVPQSVLTPRFMKVSAQIDF